MDIILNPITGQPDYIGGGGGEGGDVTASGTLTDNIILLGGGSKTVKSSGKTIVIVLGSDDDTIPTSKAVKDLLDTKASLTGAIFSGNVTISGNLINDSIQTSGSSGVVFKNSGGTTVATLGSANTTNVSFSGVVNVFELYASTNIRIYSSGISNVTNNSNIFFLTTGSGEFIFRTHSGQDQFRVVGVAGSTNYIQVSGGTNPTLSINGSQTNVSLTLKSKGTADVDISSGFGVVSKFRATSAPLNYFLFIGGITGVLGNNIQLQSAGSDTNIGITIKPKGTGIVSITSTINLVTSTYADNAAALSGGLVAGDVYKTSTGQLMIVY